jgi:hypothetical protein
MGGFYPDRPMGLKASMEEMEAIRRQAIEQEMRYREQLKCKPQKAKKDENKLLLLLEV